MLSSYVDVSVLATVKRVDWYEGEKYMVVIMHVQVVLKFGIIINIGIIVMLHLSGIRIFLHFTITILIVTKFSVSSVSILMKLECDLYS